MMAAAEPPSPSTAALVSRSSNRFVVGRRPIRSRLLFTLTVLSCLVLCTRADHRPGGSTEPHRAVGIRSMLDLHGDGIVPFQNKYRKALLLAINDSVPIADVDGIQLLSIEETLPLTGPSSEQLVRGAAASSSFSSSAAAVAAAATAAAASPSPRAPPRRRSLRQSATSGGGKGNGNGNGGPTAEEAHVHATVLLVPSNSRDVPAAEQQLRQAVGGGAPASSPLARAMLERGIPTDKVGLISLTKSSLGNGGGNAGGLGASVAAAAAGARRQQEQELQREGATATSAAAAEAADDGGLSNGAIAGVVAGVVAFVAVSTCLVAFVVRVVARRSNGGGSGAGSVEKGLGGIVKGGGDNKAAALDLSTPFSAASAASPFANARMMPSVRPSTAGSVVAGTAALATAGSGSGSSDGGSRLGRAGSPPAAAAAASAAASAPSAPSRSASEAEAAALDVPFSELKLIAPIGEGAYGRVWLARWRETAVAVKVLNAAAATAATASAPGAAGARFQLRIGGGGDNAARQQQQLPSAAPPPLLSALRREAGIMSRLRHPNVLQYLGTVAEEGGMSNCSSCSSSGVAAPCAPASSPAPAAAAAASCPHPVTAVIAEYCPHGSVADLLAAAREAVEREERSGSGKDAEGSGSGSGRRGGGGGRGGGDRAPRPDPRAVRAVRQWETRLALALGAAKGMLYLHSQSPAPVLHRDLKAANVLVDGSMRAKVADFNLAREEQEEGRRGSAAVAASSSSSSSSAGLLSDFSGGPQAATATSASSPSSSPGGGAAAANNPRWLAPEVLRGEGATTASDVYSFGVFLWELACWETPWARAPGGSWAVAIGVVERGERPPLPPPAPAAPSTDGTGNASGGGGSRLAATPGGAPADEEGYLSLMASCWAQDPRERPGFAEVIARLRPVAAAERLRRGGA